MRSGKRISDIEVLRAIAVIFIIVFHARDRLFPWKIAVWDHIVENYFSLWAGVDLFFAISGFVIARTLLPALRESADRTEFVRLALVFWVRRAWRLLPSAWLWLGIILLCSVAFNRSGLFDTFHANFESTIAGILSLANVRLAAFFGHYAFAVSSHYWSLSLEEQFYMFLPILAFLCRGRLTVTLVVITGVVFLLPQTTLLMAFRVHAILLGVLVAIFSEQPVHALFEPVFLRNRPLVSLAVLTGLSGLIAAMAVFGQGIASHNVDVIAVLCAALVLIASYDRNYLCPSPIIRRPMLWIGSRSYALYLIHVPAFVIARELWFRMAASETVPGPQDAMKLGGIGLMLLLVFTELNYRLVERPLRKYGIAVAHRLASRPLVPSTAPRPEDLSISAAPGETPLEGEAPAG